MEKTIRRLAGVVGIGALTALTFATCALAGDYHIGAGLHCGDCHIIHASHEGTTYSAGTGYVGLLKYGDINTLCLSCHGGADTTAPCVVATGTVTSASTTTNILVYGSYASPFVNSGGYFQSDWKTKAATYGHDLGPAQVTATQGTWTSGTTGMVCTDCHDQHGNSNYRNMVLNPGGAGTVTVRGGTSGTQEVYLREAITTPATAAATATHYDTDAVSFNDPNNITAWCTGCHTNIQSGTKHPQDVAISGVDDGGANWTTGTNGFGSDVGGTDIGIPRVRFAQAGTSYTTCGTAAAVATSNKVFCLSCHKAHGSKYDSFLVWPYYTSGNPDRTAACDQCHNKGL